MIGEGSFLTLKNCQAVPTVQIPSLEFGLWKDQVIREIQAGSRIAALFVAPSTKPRLFAILANHTTGVFTIGATEVGATYPSMTPACPQAQAFEREIFEDLGVRPEGHPWLKPFRKIDGVEFYQMHGHEIHEVAVGPVHAGVIEPGHFRFQCHGEEVMHLEIALGYQHRGVERALIGGPDVKTAHYMETLAGDTSVGHALAYSQAIEGLSGITVSRESQIMRGLALELERLANHVGDLGALAGDVGFLPTSSFCGGLRGDFLNLTASICGNRLGRGIVRPGGLGCVVRTPAFDLFERKLVATHSEVRDAVTLLWQSPSVLARFENTGVLSKKAAHDLGLVGPAARASGVKQDARRYFPTGIYKTQKIRLCVQTGGDVLARARVRKHEINASVDWIHQLLLDGGIPRVTNTQNRDTPIALPADTFVVSVVEGWRGEICHVAMTDDKGKILTYKVVDPSIHNWMGLALALRRQQISDFPLCNKSFNLSYCGHDL